MQTTDRSRWADPRLATAYFAPTLATERTDGLLADGEPASSALNSGFHLAYLIGAAFVVVAMAVSVTVLRPAPAPAPAEADERAEAPPPGAEPAYGKG